MKQACVATLLALSTVFNSSYAKDDLTSLTAELESMANSALSEMAMEVAIKINLSGTQSMLVQKIMTKIRVKPLKQILQQFDDTLTSLVNGDKQQKIPATTDKTILEQLEKVRTQWAKVKPALEVSDTDKASLQKVVAMNLQLLATMTKAADVYTLIEHRDCESMM